MARNLKPACKQSRRYGDMSLKRRDREIETKCNMKKKPGMHGQARGKVSVYGQQKDAKQMLKITYGVLEKPFRRYYQEASRRQGATGEILLQLLESRLDNVVYRMGLGATRKEARQLVSHKAVCVNDQPVTVPSYLVKPGDKVSIRESKQSQTRIHDSLKIAEQIGFPEWVEVDMKALSGQFTRIPDRNELPGDINEQLVVELYSK